MAAKRKAKKVLKTAKATKIVKTVSVKVKKTPAKKATKMEKTSTKKVASLKTTLKAVKPSKIGSPSKAYTQSEFLATLTKTTGLPKQSVKLVLEQIRSIIEAHLNKSGPGVFAFPGLMKMTVKTKPATKARKGLNPFTGEETTFKAKPARKVIKIKALKKLKALV
ncbi:MAG: HU family DNA-binding protein [Gammaproteobacteria bacterium]